LKNMADAEASGFGAAPQHFSDKAKF
jgi:hypothetical protein